MAASAFHYLFCTARLTLGSRLVYTMYTPRVTLRAKISHHWYRLKIHLEREFFCFCTAGWSHSAREAAKRNKSQPNTVAVDTLRAAIRRWESSFQVLIQVVSVR